MCKNKIFREHCPAGEKELIENIGILMIAGSAFSHSLCPECVDDFYGDEKWFNDGRGVFYCQ